MTNKLLKKVKEIGYGTVTEKIKKDSALMSLLKGEDKKNCILKRNYTDIKCGVTVLYGISKENPVIFIVDYNKNTRTCVFVEDNAIKVAQK